MLYKTGVLLLSMSFIACQSLDKPAAFTEAKEAISIAKADNVHDILPRSMELATRQYSDANKIWSEAAALEKNDQVTEATQRRDEAVELANSAKSIAQNGSEVVALVSTWDRNLQQYADFRMGASDTRIVSEPGTSEQIFTGDLLSKIPLAFFETDRAEVDNRYEFLVDQVASFLAQNPTAQVTLSGYADVRGNASYNQELSRQRAASVAEILKSAGVRDQQIVVEGLGVAEISGNDDELAQLQLARKVEASIQLDVAH